MEYGIFLYFYDEKKTKNYKIMDKLMLGLLSSYLEVGYYEYAEKIIVIPICVINSLGTVMLPRMSNLIEKGREREEEVEGVL